MNISAVLDGRLDSALEATLGGMAFEEAKRNAESTHEELPIREGYWASIEVAQPKVGELVLATSQAFAQELAEAATGEDGSDEDMILDVVGELANTLAGIWAKALTRNDDRETVLGIPKTGSGTWPIANSYAFATYDTEEGELVVVALIQTP